jgi:hypothetical protein
MEQRLLRAVRLSRIANSRQMRSRSLVTSNENYALKLADRYVQHRSHENDSYYLFLDL